MVMSKETECSNKSKRPRAGDEASGSVCNGNRET